jgi:hypothetical protein
MRNQPNEVLEHGRVADGPWGSTAALGNNGIFRVRHPQTGKRIRMLASNGGGWEHVSVSIEGASRCPSWEEMCWVKEQFWGPDEWVVQFHPSEAEYVNCHPFTLHLWKPLGLPLPIPPASFVGPKKTIRRHS